MAREIKEKRKNIIVYGAGVIGQIVVPEIISKFGLGNHLQFFVDADKAKHNSCIEIRGHSYVIKSKEDMKMYCKSNKNAVIWITNSRFYSVVEEMDHMEELDDIETFILPVMQLTAFKQMKSHRPEKRSKKALIPKAIHYCWFSGKEIPEHLKKCIASWEKYCPDYEIKRWDESNYDINKNEYTREAYKHQKWGFIPDYARLDILYTYGGFYFDTDVELVKNLEELRWQSAFCGVEKWGIINFGGGSGAVPGHPMIEELLREREKIPFVRSDGGLNLESSGVYETRPFIREGMLLNNRIQNIKDMTVYSFDYFHPYDYMSGETVMTDNTFSVHHFDGGWLNKEETENRKKTIVKYKQILERMKNEETVRM